MRHATPRARPLALSILIAALSTAFDALLLAFALGGFRPLLSSPSAVTLLSIWTLGNLVMAVLQPRRGPGGGTAEPEPALLLIALFTLPFIAAPLSAWGARAGVLRLGGGTGLVASGLALAALGLALRWAAIVRLGPRFTPRLAMQHGHQLETGGPYAWVRHPGYLGALIAALGGALAFGSALGLLPVALLVPALMLRVAREDRALEERFGNDYRQWRARTGGLVPRRLPRP